MCNIEEGSEKTTSTAPRSPPTQPRRERWGALKASAAQVRRAIRMAPSPTYCRRVTGSAATYRSRRPAPRSRRTARRALPQVC